MAPTLCGSVTWSSARTRASSPQRASTILDLRLLERRDEGGDPLMDGARRQALGEILARQDFGLGRGAGELGGMAIGHVAVASSRSSLRSGLASAASTGWRP